jgi:hypothetical protein
MGSPTMSDGHNPFATPLPRIRGGEAAAHGVTDMLSPQLPHAAYSDRNAGALERTLGLLIMTYLEVQAYASAATASMTVT